MAHGEAQRCPGVVIRRAKSGLLRSSRPWWTSSATRTAPHPCATTAPDCSCQPSARSVEPIAAGTAPSRVAAQHQSLLHFIGQSAWSDEAVLAKVRALTLPALERSGPVEAWIIDDTSFPKKGQPSVGVTRQYCGQLGKQDNCQVAVSVSVANEAASLPVAFWLHLPQGWARA